jgi:hypothetical protein
MSKSNNIPCPAESNLSKSNFQEENKAISFTKKYSVNKLALVP